MERLGIKRDDLAYINKEELKARLGNMKMPKAELEKKWEEHEASRKDLVQKVLDVNSKESNFPRSGGGTWARSGSSSQLATTPRRRSTGLSTRRACHRCPA